MPMLKYAHYAFGAALSVSAVAAHAGDLAPEAADTMMDSCRGEYHRVCSYVVPGGGRATRCLLDHETELSPRCLKAVKTALAVEACFPDYQRYCQGVPNGRESMACLSAKLDVLNPSCRRIVAANEPYMRGQDGERSGYGGPVFGAPAQTPYGYGGGFAYGRGYYGAQPYQGQEGERGEEAPRYQPYGGYSYGAPQPGYDRYAYGAPPSQGGGYYGYGAQPQGGGGYSEGGEPRFQRYGERFPEGGYQDRGYNGAPQEPYGEGEERER
jgi:hypothetical protein